MIHSYRLNSPTKPHTQEDVHKIFKDARDMAHRGRMTSRVHPPPLQVDKPKFIRTDQVNLHYSQIHQKPLSTCQWTYRFLFFLSLVIVAILLTFALLKSYFKHAAVQDEYLISIAEYDCHALERSSYQLSDETGELLASQAEMKHVFEMVVNGNAHQWCQKWLTYTRTSALVHTIEDLRPAFDPFINFMSREIREYSSISRVYISSFAGQTLLILIIVILVIVYFIRKQSMGQYKQHTTTQEQQHGSPHPHGIFTSGQSPHFLPSSSSISPGHPHGVPIVHVGKQMHQSPSSQKVKHT